MTSNTGTKCNRLRILVTGSSGYLGQHLLKSLVQQNENAKEGTIFDVTAAFGSLCSFASDCSSLISNSSSTLKLVNKVAFDYTSEESAKSFLNINRFDVIIHLAAMSSPFACEKSPQEAFSTNCPLPLINALNNIHQNENVENDTSGTTFIFLSTDQVYDGFRAPYTETEKAEPINEYGKSKLAFEEHLLKCHHGIKPVILRSSLMLGGVTPIGDCRKQSFCQFVHDRLSNRQATDFYTNEYRNVVFVDDVVKVICHFVQKHGEKLDLDEGPVFNMGGKERVSRFAIAQKIAEVCDLDQTNCNAVERPASSQKSQPDQIIVRSPPDISMNITKLERVTGISMLALKDMIEEIYQ